MAGTENVDHTPGKDRLGKPVGGGTDLVLLFRDAVDELAAACEVFGGGRVQS